MENTKTTTAKRRQYVVSATTITAAREARAAVQRARRNGIPTDIADAEAAQAAATASIATAINAVETRARIRCLTADDLLSVLERVEDRLGISPNAMRDVTIRADVNGQHFPRSYRGFPESTQFEARYTSKGWAVTWIGRSRVSAPTTAIRITLTDAARAAVMHRAQYIAV